MQHRCNLAHFDYHNVQYCIVRLMNFPKSLPLVIIDRSSLSYITYHLPLFPLFPLNPDIPDRFILHYQFIVDPIKTLLKTLPDSMCEAKDQFDSFIHCFGFTVFCLICGIIVFRLVLFIWRTYIKRGVKWCGGPDTWAVVTGATDGIGLEYARQLADKGYNLLLISRTQSKLDKVREEITARHPQCEVNVLAVDFGRTDIYARIGKELASLDEVHVLVNNVGIFTPNEFPYPFLDVPDLDQFITNTININMNACTRLIHLVLPSMVSHGRGVIINMSSMFADSPKPLMCLYSASKAYVCSLSQALHEEYYRKGVTVQTVIPGFVDTKMAQTMSLPALIFPKASTFVRSALYTVGRYDTTSAYFGHKVMHLFGFTSVQFLSNITGIDLSIKINHLIGQLLRRNILTRQKHHANFALINNVDK